MVKHCLTIYDDCNDAWERAQTEELAVFKKCNTVVIYKSSALLAINKLRKESLGILILICFCYQITIFKIKTGVNLFQMLEMSIQRSKIE